MSVGLRPFASLRKPNTGASDATLGGPPCSPPPPPGGPPARRRGFGDPSRPRRVVSRRMSPLGSGACKSFWTSGERIQSSAPSWLGPWTSGPCWDQTGDPNGSGTSTATLRYRWRYRPEARTTGTRTGRMRTGHGVGRFRRITWFDLAISSTPSCSAAGTFHPG